MRSADTTHCVRAGQYYDYCCYSSQSLRADLQSLLLPLFLFMEESEIGSWWDLQDLFFIIDLFQSLSNCFFAFLKYTYSSKDKSEAGVLFLNVFLHLFLLYSFFSLCTHSLTKAEMNGIPFWKGMRNRCKHACVGQGILWNLFNCNSRFRKTFEAGSLLNCYQQAQRDNCPCSYINKQINIAHKCIYMYKSGYICFLEQNCKAGIRISSLCMSLFKFYFLINMLNAIYRGFFSKKLSGSQHLLSLHFHRISVQT